MPSEVIATPGSFASVLDKALGGIADSILKATEVGLHKAALESKRHVVKVIGTIEPYAPINFGKLRDGYRVRQSRVGKSFHFVLENIESYAPRMEFGTAPEQVPFDTLLTWAHQKNRITKRHGQAARGRGKAAQATRAALDNALAKRAQRSIAKKGIAPRNFHAIASQRFIVFVRGRLISELRRLR